MAPYLGKRKAENEAEAQVPRKNCKRLAVTKTTKRSTIALIQTNAATSPLLSLPGEIREKILGYLLGDKSVHVKLRSAFDDRSGEGFWGECSVKWENEGILGNGFLQHVCESSPAEVFDYPTAPHVKAEDEDAQHCCHAKCVDYQLVRDDQPGYRVDCNALDLSVLGSCRQLYEEANHILWTTNLFIFDDAYSLPVLLSKINPAQKRKITSIHIYARTRYLFGSTSWRKGISAQTVEMLSGLKKFSLDLHYNYLQSAYHPRGYDRDTVMQQELSIFKNFKASSLQKAAVHLESVTPQGLPFEEPLRLTLAEEATLAADFRAALLDPNGADSVRKEREANKRQPRIWTKSTIRREFAGTQRIVDRIKKNAQRLNQRARGVDMKLKQVEKQIEMGGKKTEGSLGYQAARLRDKAIAWREAAEEAAGRVERWQRTENKKKELMKLRLAKLGINGEKKVEKVEKKATQKKARKSEVEMLGL